MRGPVALVRMVAGAPVYPDVRAEQSCRSAGIVMRLHEEEVTAWADNSPEGREHFVAAMEVVQALEDQRRVDRRIRDVSAEVQGRCADDLDVTYPVGCTSLAQRPLHVGYEFDRDHRRGTPGNHRREVPAPRAEVESSTVAFWRPDLFDQPTARVVVLLGLAVPVVLV